MTPNEIRNTLDQFCGTENWYRHPLFRKFLYTDGVKFVVDSCGANWLLTDILAYQLNPKVAAEEFQVWTLKKTDSSAVLSCGDGNDNTVFSTEIIYTDFPLEEISLWLENNVLMLPGER